MRAAGLDGSIAPRLIEQGATERPAPPHPARAHAATRRTSHAGAHQEAVPPRRHPQPHARRAGPGRHRLGRAPLAPEDLARLPASAAPPPLANGELAAVLTRVGLDAEPLAAAGLDPAQVQGIVARARQHLGDAIVEVRQADRRWAEARRDLDRLEGLVRAGTATPQDLGGRSPAQEALATATAARQSALTAAFAAATDGLDPAALATINAVKASRAAGWDLPAQYMASPRSQPEWVALRDALATQRINPEYGQPVPADTERLLLAEHARPATAAAHANLDRNRQTLTHAWNNAVHTP